jgi:hypothetical protein
VIFLFSTVLCLLGSFVASVTASPSYEAQENISPSFSFSSPSFSVLACLELGKYSASPLISFSFFGQTGDLGF